MDAEAKSFTFLANESQVTIPFFQRGYVWDVDNWTDLLADLFNADRRHYLGSLILKQQRRASGEPNNVTVIDGQQRLTTLSILLKAVYDSLPAEIKENCKPAVRTHLFFKRYQTDPNYLVRIHHSHVDAAAYTAVIKAGLDGPATDANVNSPNRIFRCYSFFCAEMAKRPVEDATRLFNRILDPQEKMLVVIDLLEDDDEQTIFDTTNTAGVRLSGSDVIKNALFQRVIQLQTDEQRAVELYNRTWARLFLLDDETIQFWERKKLTGRLMRDNSEVLLHSIAVIKGFYDPAEHQLSELSKLYKAQIAQFQSAAELVAFIEEITRYAKLYRDKIPEFETDVMMSFNDASLRLFHILDVLQISTFHPFILYVLHEHRTDEAQCAAILLQLERFVVRRVLAQKETKNFNKIARDFITNHGALATEAKQTTDEEVVNGLKKAISNKYAALVLFWIELRRRSLSRKYDITELKYDYSLEHIMPQKWEQYWKNLPEKRDVSGGIMGPDDAKKDRKEKVYWLGNMTLLTSSLNSSLRNYAFQEKMVGDGRKKGVKAYAFLSITHDDIVEPFDRGDTTWDETKIAKRTEVLSKEVLDIWGA